MNEKPTFEEFIKIMAESMGLKVTPFHLECFRVWREKSQLTVDIPMHKMGCCGNHPKGNCPGRIVFDDVINTNEAGR
jgi:hypothetical protein